MNLLQSVSNVIRRSLMFFGNGKMSGVLFPKGRILYLKYAFGCRRITV